MATIWYGTTAFAIDDEQLAALKAKVIAAANGERHEWLTIGGSALLIGPGVPVRFDESDPG